MSKTVLIVEDDAPNRKLFRDVLQANGYVTEEAPDGKQAIDLARRRRYDLILMDIQLPGASGVETMRSLRAAAETRAVPVVALTGFALPSDRARFLREGFDNCLTKPVDLDEFLQVVARYVADCRAADAGEPQARAPGVS